MNRFQSKKQDYQQFRIENPDTPAGVMTITPLNKKTRSAHAAFLGIKWASGEQADYIYEKSMKSMRKRYASVSHSWDWWPVEGSWNVVG